ncbi:MAG: ABC transporter permease subunit [Acetobacteraceae bacterium]|nr:ABC transporter permease subunit [Acetobacteraceae bacterium]MBV8589649.1 ABC transporter permease subunit [Acetobacteraceae bacterium]
MLVFSFNDSRLLTVWTGFSWRWYVALWQDRALIEAGLLSLRIAALSATGATVLGAMAGFALARFGRFRGRGGLAAILAVPLVLPDAVAGLALLLLFVALERLVGWPAGRGAVTVTLAHMSFSLAYVAIVVQGRLAGAGVELEEAAADLGAPPGRVFRRVTLPLMAPALVSGWLLAFTLSLDDVVIASFTTGPGATTLPMVLFSSMKLGPTPEMFALASVVLGVVLLALLGASLARVASAEAIPR